MGNVDTDTKLRLIQDIRQQTQYNRIKCREREHFLYGSSLELPKGELYGTENASLKETANNAAFPQGSKGKMSSFRIRLMLSVILFGAFIFWNNSGSKIYNVSAVNLYERLTETMDMPSAFSEQINKLSDTSRR